VSSNRWRKAKARVTALHTLVANQCRDGLHQLTTRLVHAVMISYRPVEVEVDR
jgi:transposase